MLNLTGGGDVAAPVIHKPKLKARAKALTVRFDKDRLHLVPRNEAAKAAFAMLDKVQDEMPELAIAATALVFATLCQRLRLDPHDIHQLGMKMLRHDPHNDKANAQIEGMQDLAKQQWEGKEL